MLTALVTAATVSSSQSEVMQDSGGILKVGDSLLHLNGRTGSGFKFVAEDLSSIVLNLGPHTTQPEVAIGLSLNYGPFINLNVTEGANILPLISPNANTKGSKTVIRLNAQGWQNNRLNVESIVLNNEAKLQPYTPSKLAFQFIGDSLSAGQYLPNGVDGAWPFLTGETFKAEHNVQAQPGACLTDILSYGNVHGVSYEFFRTYLTFTDRLRTLYPYQPFLVFTPWGWPNPDGTVNQYYEGRYEEIVTKRHIQGDKNVFLVNTTGWVTYADVFPANQHPTTEGHIKISGLFTDWLKKWGLQPEASWPTLPN
ncbi:hypothetical protein Clacol_003485 [Clathrus columnatus]|uniref:SGNH hydrolase-type esterase domain-containing protein n=1 Tax=Clathrus columnatus TaxID=1419009 RepID=A0AAV5A7S4_9AGAM|nr:hypothetical protein Clacol_003485 [Clathrus columnatus]